MLIAPVFLLSPAAAEADKIFLSEEAAWPPFTEQSEGVAKSGLSFALMSELFTRLDSDFEIKLCPMKRCVMQMKRGTRDAIALISQNRERHKFLEYSLPLIESSGYIYYDSDKFKAVKWQQFSDLQNYKIGLVMGYNYGEALQSMREKNLLQIQEVVRIEQNFKKLLAGRIDIMLANQAEISGLLNKNPKYRDRIKAAPQSYIHYSYHMGFSKKSEARQLLPAINRIITGMKKDGTLAKIIAGYLPTSLGYRNSIQ